MGLLLDDKSVIHKPKPKPGGLEADLREGLPFQNVQCTGWQLWG